MLSRGLGATLSELAVMYERNRMRQLGILPPPPIGLRSDCAAAAGPSGVVDAGGPDSGSADPAPGGSPTRRAPLRSAVYQHRLLSTAQLHALYRDGLSLRRTQRALGAMEQVGWLASVCEPGGMKLWFVTDSGADAVEAIGNRAELRRKVIPAAQAAGPLQQHTLAANEVGVAFVRAARERAPDEFGPLGWRNEIAHAIGPRPGRLFEELIEQGPFAPIFMDKQQRLVDWLGNPPPEPERDEAEEADPAADVEGAPAGEPEPEPEAPGEIEPRSPAPDLPTHREVAAEEESPLLRSLRMDRALLRERRRHS